MTLLNIKKWASMVFFYDISSRLKCIVRQLDHLRIKIWPMPASLCSADFMSFRVAVNLTPSRRLRCLVNIKNIIRNILLKVNTQKRNIIFCIKITYKALFFKSSNFRWRYFIFSSRHKKSKPNKNTILCFVLSVVDLVINSFAESVQLFNDIKKIITVYERLGGILW